MPGLSFFAPSLQDRLVPLPSTVTRSYVPTLHGQLELLTAEPPSTYTGPRKTAIFLAHGGCGSAAVWIEWMDYLTKKHNIPCYALSYRGHGASWYPWYLSMYFTTARTLASDLTAGFRHVQSLEQKLHGTGELVLVAHSNGGGLAQIALDAGDIRPCALALVAATPVYGSIGVNRNWSALDKWFMPRMYLKHFGNPMSPLSSAALVKQAFFCSAYPLDAVEKFRRNMPSYESFLWPFDLIFRIADPGRVLSNINGFKSSENSERRQRLLLLAGEEDKLMSMDLMIRQAAEYRAAAKDGYGNENGVAFEVVKGSGHHLQNDLQWEWGAKLLVAWYKKL